MEFNSDLSSDTMAANLEKDLQENIGFNISTILVQSGYEKTASIYVNDLLEESGDQLASRAVGVQETIPGNTEQSSVLAPFAESHGIRLELNDNLDSLADLLLKAASHEGKGITFLDEPSSELFVTYAELLNRARRIAKGLQIAGLSPGEHVLFQCKSNFNFISGFWACILGGFIPAPIGAAPTYTEKNAALNKLYNSWELLGHPAILSDEANVLHLQALEEFMDFTAIRVFAIEVLEQSEFATELPVKGLESFALSLLTSGSTGIPKCVQHRNKSLLALVQSVSAFFELSSREVWLNWMPLDHVGGIVFSHLTSVYLGCKQVIAATETFMSDPLQWLELIDKYQASMSWAPNFAFALVAAEAENVKQKSWNLSSMRYIINAAESIVPKTAYAFLHLLAPFGLKTNAISPAFGMSETSSGVTFSKEFCLEQNRLAGVHHIDKLSLSSTLKVINENHINCVSFVELGRPIPNMSIRIVDQDNQLKRERQIGRLQVKGPDLMDGYYLNPTANSESFVGDGWFNTGDLGFLQDGVLTLTGREKDMIILNGKNHFNYEIEAVMEEVFGVETTFTAAATISAPGEHEDQLALFFTPYIYDPSFYLQVVEDIKYHIVKHIGIEPTYLIPVSKESFPKTNSGKIQHSELVKRFRAGEFHNEIKLVNTHLEINTLPSWFFQRVWKEQRLVQLTEKQFLDELIMFSDRLGLADSIAEKLAVSPGLDKQVYFIYPGESYKQIDQFTFEINPDRMEDYVTLFVELEQAKVQIRNMLHLWNYTPYSEMKEIGQLRLAQRTGSLAIVALYQAIAEKELSVNLLVATTYAGSRDNTSIAYEKATIESMLRAGSQEYPAVISHQVDFSDINAGLHSEQILEEFRVGMGGDMAYYAGSIRYIAALEIVDAEALMKEQKPAFDDEGLYLVTGGLGAVGELVVRHLLQRHRATIVLLGRTVLPPQEQWGSVIEQDSELAVPLLRYIELQKLTESGGKVEYQAVDVTNYDRIKELIEQYESSLQKQLSGVIHLAGVGIQTALTNCHDDQIEQLYNAKVYGTFILHQLLLDRPDSVFITTSSAETLDPGMMMGPYSASNRFVEAFAGHIRNTSSLRCQCFAWGMWDSLGMSHGNTAIQSMLMEKGFYPITAEKGILSFEIGSRLNQPVLYIGLNERKARIAQQLLHPPGQEYTFYAYLLASGDNKQAVQDLQANIQHFMMNRYPSVHYKIKFRMRNELPETATGQIDREALLQLELSLGYSEYTAPRNEAEERLARIWAKVLGKERIGIHDNFFALGGNSLRIIQMISIVQEQFGVRITIQDLFQSATIAELAGRAVHGHKNEQPLIPLVNRQGSLMVSQGQKQQWYFFKREPESPYYNTAFTLEIKGDLSVDHLTDSLQSIVNRHEVLQSFYTETDGELYSYVDRECGLNFSVQDLSGLTMDEQELRLHRLLQAETNKPFNLEQAPLYRFQLIKCSHDSHILFVVMHHIIFDGWSVGLFLNELADLYSHFAEQAPIVLPELPIQYADYAAWEGDFSNQPSYSSHLEYWSDRFTESVPVLDFPTDFTRPRVLSHEGKTIAIEIDSRLKACLIEIGRAEDCTLYVTLFAAFVALLHRYTHQEEMIIGSIVANRRVRQTQELIGYFVNTLPLSFHVSGDDTFAECLRKVKNEVLEVLDHGEAAFENIMERLPVQRDASRHPLFQLLFALHENYFEHTRMGKLQTRFSLLSTNTAKFDLALHAYPASDNIVLHLEYNTGLFSDSRMNAFLKYYTQMLEGISGNIDQPIGQISFIPPEEQAQLRSINDFHAIGYPHDVSLTDLFEQQVFRTPNHVAVCFGQNQLTYANLNERANQLARQLRLKGIEQEQFVGMIMDRSLEMIVGVLAVLKAGGAYVPIDPDFPEERIDYILKDCKAGILLTQSHLTAPAGFQGHTLNIDRAELYTGDGSNLPPVNRPENLAYVIYTSGTTGKPKGVLMEHRNVVRLFFNDRPLFNFRDTDVWTMFHSYTFDFSVWEMYGALLHGGMLVVVSKQTAQDPQQFLSLVNKHHVTVLNQTPTAFYGLLKEILHQGVTSLPLRYVIFGGEALAPIMLQEIAAVFPSIQYINMYGITETAVHVTFKKITSKEIDSNVSDIGQPIPTLKAYVMDSRLQLVPVGVTGELFIGGEGLARGYLNLPELTNEKFIHSPFADNERLYRSGDLVKMLPDGSLEYQGRMDHQVKIRGHRIELGDIESQLLRHPAVSETIVLARPNIIGNHELTAYIVSDRKLTKAEIRDYLNQRLPGYMIPSYFIQMDRIPLTANGKVDRKKLPNPDEQMDSGIQFEPPATEEEELLMGIWRERLAVEHFGVHDDFFILGGDSIKAIRMVTSINECLNSSIKIKDLYQYPTIRSLYTYMQSESVSEGEAGQWAIARDQILARWKKLKQDVCEAAQGQEEWSGKIADVYPMSDVQLGMVYHGLKNPDEAMYHDQFGYDLNVNLFNLQQLKNALKIVVESHPVLRTALCVDRFAEPVQIVFTEVPISIEMESLEMYSPFEQHQLIRRYFEDDKQAPFQIQQAPLWRVKVFSLGGHHVKVCVSCHHAILDGWSLAAFMTEWIQLYVQGNEASTRPVELHASPKDFILEQEELKNYDSYKAFWRQELEDYRRYEVSTSEDYSQQHSFVIHELDKPILNQLKDVVARKYRTNLKSILFSAYIAALNMFSYDNDLLVGLVEHCRPECEDGDRILGCYLNTVPFRTRIEEDWTWRDLLQSVQNKTIEMKTYGRLSLLEIYRCLGEAAQGENPLVDTMFNFVDFHVYEDLAETGLNDDYFSLDMELLHDRNHTLLDFTVSVTLDQCIIRIGSIWEPEKTRKLIAYFEKILYQFIHASEEKIDKAVLLSAEEYDNVVQTLNDTDIIFDSPPSLLQLFEERAAASPERVALVFGNEQLTYGELDRKTNQLAHYLREKGVQENSIVGIAAERSFEMLVGIIAILKAGGAYLPIDPNYPIERVRYILEHSGSALILTQLQWKSSYEQLNVDVFDLSDEALYTGDGGGLARIHKPDDLAYVIYTSGSTGRPKGVMIEHASLMNLLYTLEAEYPLEEADTYLLKTTFTFDVSITELFGWIVGEGKLVILPPDGEKDIMQLFASIQEHKITHLNFVPSMLQMMLQYEQLAYHLSSIKYVFVAGEAFPAELARKFRRMLPGARLENIYGPTEATVYATNYSIQDDSLTSVPIGRPLSNVKVYVVNKLGQLQPPGVPGELCIAGAGVARGYLNNKELTGRSFVQSPVSGSGKMYRTGDLVRWAEAGTLQYMGRIDLQVKVRGYRIEMGEIEQQMVEIEPVEQVAVVLKRDENGRAFLCSYYVSDQPLEVHTLRAHAGRALPNYMIPAYFVRLPQLPLTNSGKIDRKMLEQMPLVPEAGPTEDCSSQALSHLEEQLAEIWRGVFNNEVIRVSDSFYAMGGDSILAIQLSAKLNEQGFFISVGDILKHQSIANICSNVNLNRERRQYEQGLVRGEKPLTPIDYWFMDLNWSKPGHYVQTVQMDLTMVPIIDHMESSFRLLLEHHDGLRLNCNLEEKHIFYNEAHLATVFQIGVVDISQRQDKQAALQEVSKDLQRPFDLSNDLLIRASLIQVECNDWKLMASAHHLVVDGVSWRILLDDLFHIYRSLLQNRVPSLPAKTVSLQEYGNWLETYAKTMDFSEELAYWTTVQRTDFSIPSDLDTTEWQFKHFKSLEGVLNRQQTGSLKRIASRALSQASVQNVLLSSLVKSLKDWANTKEVIVDLESHGRHSDEINSSRTVGWFTSMYPARLSIPDDTDLKQQIQNVSRQLQAIPNQGFHYGILTYLTEQLPARKEVFKEVQFNFLGEFASSGHHELFSGFQLTADTDEDHEHFVKLDVTCWITDGLLTVALRYNSKSYLEATIRNLLDRYLFHIQTIIGELSEDDTHLTTDALDAADLSSEELEALFE